MVWYAVIKLERQKEIHKYQIVQELVLSIQKQTLTKCCSRVYITKWHGANLSHLLDTVATDRSTEVKAQTHKSSIHG